MDPTKLPDDLWRHGELRIEFQQENTKKKSKAFDRYELYKHSSNVVGAMKTGATCKDLQDDLCRTLLIVANAS